jgi:hypothetical protein
MVCTHTMSLVSRISGNVPPGDIRITMLWQAFFYTQGVCVPRMTPHSSVLAGSQLFQGEHARKRLVRPGGCDQGTSMYAKYAWPGWRRARKSHYPMADNKLRATASSGQERPRSQCCRYTRRRALCRSLVTRRGSGYRGKYVSAPGYPPGFPGVTAPG